MADTDTIEKTGTGIKTEEQTKKPAMYAVVVHNDPYTPRNFVVEVLQLYFQKNAEEAAHIMLNAHKTGLSVVSVYTYEVAETKCAKANKYSHDQGKILLFSVEEA
jgi:ATP-dependent Clp protease adaptor protein ClpS